MSFNRNYVGLLHFGIASIRDAVISKLAKSCRTVYRSRKTDDTKLSMETRG
jgi:hypothetical protein